MCTGHIMSRVDHTGHMMSRGSHDVTGHIMSHVDHTGHMMSHAGISLPPAVSKDILARVRLCGSEPWSPAVCWDRGDQL